MKKIVILSGWTGAEIEIAKKSANFFKKYLSKDYDYYELPKQLDSFLENKDKYSLAIPVFHWEYGEDGRMFAFLDILGIPHTFSSYDVHSILLDKYKWNLLVEDLFLNVPKQYLFLRKVDFKGDTSHIEFPIILKPNRWGSSFFAFRIESEEELIEKLIVARECLSDDILVQDFVEWEEYSVPIVNGEILPIMKLEKQNENDFFDYDSKYESADRIKETWPIIEESLEMKLRNQSLKVYNYFRVQGFCRIDFLVKDWEVFFLEVNTIPGMTDASILPKSWLITWKSFEELVEELIK